MLEICDKASASCDFVFQTAGSPIRMFLVMGIFDPLESVAKKATGSAKVLTLRKMVDRQGAHNSGFLNIAELDNPVLIPEKLIRWSLAEVAGDILPFLFAR